MSRTTEDQCPDCSGFDRCDYHTGVRHGRQEARDDTVNGLTVPDNVDHAVAAEITQNFLDSHKDDPIKKARDAVQNIAKELLYVIGDVEKLEERRMYTIDALRETADYLEEVATDEGDPVEH